MNRVSRICLSALALVMLSRHPAAAQAPPTASDASWAKAYATDCGHAMKHPCPASTNGYENAFNGDPRLLALLKHSLPQHESWWVNGYGGSTPVSGIVQEFIGVPHDLLVDDDRYVTATGCVPHDCLDGGMLWIDTAAKPATVIFAGATDVRAAQVNPPKHVWIYTSTNAKTLTLPPNFLRHLAAWYKADIDPKGSVPVALTTIVLPNGRMNDFLYKTVFEQMNQPLDQQNKPGAKQ
jgi:hypothetical protein